MEIVRSNVRIKKPKNSSNDLQKAWFKNRLVIEIKIDSVNHAERKKIESYLAFLQPDKTQNFNGFKNQLHHAGDFIAKEARS